MRTRGITLIEILVTITILLIVASIVVGSFRSVTSTYELKRVTNTVATMIEEARSYSISSKNGSKYSIRVEPTRVIRYEGTIYNSSDVNNYVFDLGSNIIVASSSFVGGTTTVTFEKITGKTYNYGSINFAISGATTSSSTISINKTGIITVR